jgi:hypothetical protein
MAGFGMMLAGAAQGFGESIVEQARAKREAALRQQEREQEREWQVADRDIGYQRDREREDRGYAREDASTNRAAGALSGIYGSDLLGLIDATEGGGDYDTLFGHSQRDGNRFAGVRVSDMTLAEVFEFSDPSGEYGQWVQSTNPEGVVATPMGRYQIVGTTLRNAAEELGLDPSTRFTPEVQDQIAMHLAERRLNSASTIEGKREALRDEWAGFRNVDDATLDAAIRQYEAGPDAWFAAADPNVSADVRGNIGNGLGMDPDPSRSPANPTNQFWNDNGDGTETRYGTVDGALVPVNGSDGQPFTRQIQREPVEVSNSTLNRLEENTDLIDLSGPGADQADADLVATVAEEISRLMNEEGMTETQAYTAAIRAMQIVDETTETPRTGFLGLPTVRGPIESTTRRLGGFDYGTGAEPEPDRSQTPEPAMPTEPAMPGLGAGPVSGPVEEAPRNAADRVTGKVYRAPDGRMVRWTGAGWELVNG